MFNFDAEQIFVTQPRNAGGGILAFLLSLDSNTAALNFKTQSKKEKLLAWNNHFNKKETNAHVYGFNNFGHQAHSSYVDQADFCQKYIHKHHFFELDCDNQDKQHPWLAKMPVKKGVGIYLTPDCQQMLTKVRPYTPEIDVYQMWVYANQQKLLLDFYGINCLHTIAFKELLDSCVFLEHLNYCREIFDLDVDYTNHEDIIKAWCATMQSLTS